MPYLILAILIIVALAIIIKTYSFSKTQNVGKHAYCCDKCRIKELCNDYKIRKNIKSD